MTENSSLISRKAYRVVPGESLEAFFERYFWPNMDNYDTREIGKLHKGDVFITIAMIDDEDYALIITDNSMGWVVTTQA